MKRIALSVILCLCAVLGMQAQNTEIQRPKYQPIQMILDSDFGSSTDDLFKQKVNLAEINS